MKPWFIVSVVFGLALCCAAQQPPIAPLPTQQTGPALDQRLEELRARQRPRGPDDYKIGAEDLLEIAVFEVPELSKTVRVTASGEIGGLPGIAGRIKVAGLSSSEAERLLVESWKSYVKDPQVTVFIREYRADPVSVVGAVRMPNLYYIQTRRSLIEVITMAGGMSEKAVGKSIIITRKAAPPASASAAETVQKVSSTAQIIEIPIRELLQTGDPKWNIDIYPGDAVRVVAAGQFYIAGAVTRPGAYALTEFDTISALQALAVAGGPTRTASKKNAAVIHLEPNGTRTERKIDLARLQKGKDTDLFLGPNDVLFVPGSARKEAVLRAIEASITLGTGLVLYGRY